MDKVKELARAFFLEAKKDFERAKIMFDNKDYPATVFYCQQSVEKSLKSIFILKGYDIRIHDLLPYINLLDFDERKKEKIRDILSFFKYDWSLTRYPIVTPGKIIIPEEEYKEDRAKKALEYAEYILNLVEEYLKENVLWYC